MAPTTNGNTQPAVDGITFTYTSTGGGYPLLFYYLSVLLFPSRTGKTNITKNNTLTL